MILYHGSNTIVDEPVIVRTKYAKDFGWGFYTTENEQQAEQWANRRSDQFGGSPTVSVYEVEPMDELKVLSFSQMNDEWLDFIADCRNGKLHDYDVVSGPMADDQIWDYVSDYLAGNITREAFFALAKFKHPTQQTSFHTIRALSLLNFVEAKVL